MAITQAQLDSVKPAGYEVIFYDGTNAYTAGLLKEDTNIPITPEEDLQDLMSSQSGMTPIKTFSKGTKFNDIEFEIWTHDKYQLSKITNADELDATSVSDTEAGVIEYRSKILSKPEFAVAIYPVNQEAGTTLTVASTNPRTVLFYKAAIINSQYNRELGVEVTPFKVTIRPLADPVNDNRIMLVGAGVDPTDLSVTITP